MVWLRRCTHYLFIVVVAVNSTLLTINSGDYIITIDDNYNRTKVQIFNDTTVVSLNNEYPIIVGITVLVEGNEINNTSVNNNAFNGLDDDLDGLIDENYYLHYRQKRIYYNESTGAQEVLLGSTKGFSTITGVSSCV